MNDEEDNMEVEQPNPLNNMIDFVQNAEFNKASNIFGDLIGQKVADALEQEKIGIASTMWGQPEDEDASQESDEDISDEDLEAAAAEIDAEDGDDIEYDEDGDDDEDQVSQS